MYLILLSLVLCIQCDTNGNSKNDQALFENIADPNFVVHVVNPKKQNLAFFWQDENNKNFFNFKRLKSWLEGENKKLLFAMNGGMYNKDSSPQGLYIEKGQTMSKVDAKENGYGNFYLQPNGIFGLTAENEPIILKTEDFEQNSNLQFATQSGPMLLIEGDFHPKFRAGSENTHIRNGVGILPSGNLIFAMSKQKINFYDFANFFKKQGCKNALYLDGFVSRTYLPEKNWIQEDGNFGVIIAEVE